MERAHHKHACFSIKLTILVSCSISEPEDPSVLYFQTDNTFLRFYTSLKSSDILIKPKFCMLSYHHMRIKAKSNYHYLSLKVFIAITVCSKSTGTAGSAHLLLLYTERIWFFCHSNTLGGNCKTVKIRKQHLSFYAVFLRDCVFLLK